MLMQVRKNHLTSLVSSGVLYPLTTFVLKEKKNED